MCAFTSCSSWANCNFPQHENCLYDDNTVNVTGPVNYCNYNGNECDKQQALPSQQQQPNQIPSELYYQQQQQQQYYGTVSNVNGFYDNTSSTNEQCINLNTTFYPTNEENTNNHQQQYNYNNNNNNIGGASMLKRHHPYQRASSTYQSLYHHQNQQQPFANASAQFQQIPTNPTRFYSTPRPTQTIYYNSTPTTTTTTNSSMYHHQPHGTEFENIPQQPSRIHLSAPCQGNQPWSYAYCYGYAHPEQEPCQYTQFVDIEDFMNNEKRKEKSRDAARCRRSRETEIFADLAQVLPLKKEDVNQLDKASIMRVAIAYLKIRDMLQMFPKLKVLAGDLLTEDNALVIDYDNDSNASTSSKSSQESVGSLNEAPEKELDLLVSVESKQLIKETMDGFLIVLSNDGDITYVTDNITDYLGIAKIDILGQQIWEYSHQCDHAELKDALNIKRNGLMADKIKAEYLQEDGLSTDHRDLYVRFKCTLTSRGRSINIKSASYKVIHITGHLVVNRKGDRVLVAIGRPIPHPSNIEIPLGSSTFLTKHSLDMKFTYVDDKMLNLFGYQPDDLLEKSLYECHYGEDSESLMATFKAVLSKGQGETCRYRFLGKRGGYCWIVTQATTVYDKMKPQSVVCVNYVISNLENNNEIYSLAQYEASQKKLEENNNNNNNKENNNTNNACVDDKPKQQPIKQEPESSIKTTLSSKLIDSTNLEEPLETTPTITPPPPTKTTAEIAKPTSPPTLTETPISNPTRASASIKRENSPTAATAIVNNTNGPLLCPVAPLVRHLNQTTLNSRATTTTLHIAENRPKSVTASVFRPNPQVSASVNTLAAFNTHIQLIEPPEPIIDVTPVTATPTKTSEILANSTVTASVLTPLSQLPQNKFNQHLVKTTTAILGQNQQQQQQQQQQLQQQDMNKGFLSFPEDATELTMLKEEPDDLVHLGQSPIVDACMPLDETNSLFSDVLVGFIGTYGASLLNDDINSLDSTASSTRTTGSPSIHNCNSSAYNHNSNSNSSISSPLTAGVSMQQHHQQQQQQQQQCNNNHSKGAHIDPLINYRDQSNDTSCSPQHLLSPNMAAKSPDGSSLPSLCSPDSLSQEDEFAFMSMSVNDEIEIDLSMRAPYIPMNEQDDLPLLTDDLMWCSSSSFSEELSMHKDSDATMQQLQMHHQHQQQQQQQHQQQQQMGDILSYQQQQQFSSNSLCSSPASTVSSMSPSPVHNHHLHQHHPQQQQPQHQQDSNDNAGGNTVFGDSSELAALLCGAGNGTLSILNGGVNSGGVKDDSNNNNGSGSGVHHINRKSAHCTQLGDSMNTDSDFRIQLQQQQQQQQQPQQQLLGLNIDCKKEKYENSLGSSSICDSIEDAFVSNNLDCWSELLQINVNDNSTASSASPGTTSTSTTTTATTITPQIDDLQQQQNNCKTSLQLQQQQHIQQQQQNVLLNAVPLMTIQSNKNIMLQHQQQQQLQRSNSNTAKLLLSEEMLTGNRIANNNNNNNNKVTTIKLINGCTATVAPITTTATIRVVDSKMVQQQQQQQQRQQSLKKNPTIIQAITQQQQQHGNKRHLTSTTGQTQTERKRLKSATTAATATTQIPSTTKTVELLQQLMASPTATANGKETPTTANTPNVQRKGQNHLWLSNGDMKMVNTENPNILNNNRRQQQQQQTQSHSVLKNLLISGCDNVLNVITKPEEMMLDETSLQSPCISPYPKPLQTVGVSDASVMRNYRNNPMIGGTGILPSPSFVPRDDDSSPPGLTACDTDAASDSGIDDISLGDNVSPLNIKHVNDARRCAGGLLMKYPNMNSTDDLSPSTSMAYASAVSFGGTAASGVLDNGTLGLADNLTNVGGDRKNALSFMETDENPLLTPPLPMDLWNEPSFLEDTDFGYGLNEWAH